MKGNIVIEELTKEQEALLSVYADKWIKIGLSTEPLDFEAAKEAARKAYRLAGLKEPTQFFKAKSPMDAIRVIKELDPSKDENTIFNEMDYGNHNANWIGFYEYFRNVLNIEECKKLDGHVDLAHVCGWVSFYEDVVVFQDRPNLIKMDEQNRVHCENGPCIQYPDGLSFYCWHGTAIPAEWIEDKENLTAKIAITWDNIEQRRCACEIIGWNKILEELNAKVIDTDGDPEIGQLVEVELPDSGKEKFLRVVCGTGRLFAIPVPPEMKTALEAQSWSWGLSADEFIAPEVRT